MAGDSAQALRVGPLASNASIGMRSDSKVKRTIDCSELKEMTLRPYQVTGNETANADLEELSKDIEPTFIIDSGVKNLAHTQDVTNDIFNSSQSQPRHA